MLGNGISRIRSGPTELSHLVLSAGFCSIGMCARGRGVLEFCSSLCGTPVMTRTSTDECRSPRFSLQPRSAKRSDGPHVRIGT